MASNPNYPKRLPDFDQLPREVDGPPQDELIETDAYEDAGETADVDVPPLRSPVDVRVSRPTPTETKTAVEPPERGDIEAPYQ
jgi:hypothetical protein